MRATLLAGCLVAGFVTIAGSSAAYGGVMGNVADFAFGSGSVAVEFGRLAHEDAHRRGAQQLGEAHGTYARTAAFGSGAAWAMGSVLDAADDFASAPGAEGAEDLAWTTVSVALHTHAGAQSLLNGLTEA